jgi:peptidoglycan/LPS O-acetylase OafA/YrhL
LADGGQVGIWRVLSTRADWLYGWSEMSRIRRRLEERRAWEPRWLWRLFITSFALAVLAFPVFAIVQPRVLSWYLTLAAWLWFFSVMGIQALYERRWRAWGPRWLCRLFLASFALAVAIPVFAIVEPPVPSWFGLLAAGAWLWVAGVMVIEDLYERRWKRRPDLR